MLTPANTRKEGLLAVWPDSMPSDRAKCYPMVEEIEANGKRENLRPNGCRAGNRTV